MRDNLYVCNIKFAIQILLITLENLDKKHHVKAVFLDFSKTFDTIDNQLSLFKLLNQCAQIDGK